MGGQDYHRHDPNISFPHQNYKFFCLETNPLGKPSAVFLQATGLLVLGVKLLKNIGHLAFQALHFSNCSGLDGVDQLRSFFFQTVGLRQGCR